MSHPAQQGNEPPSYQPLSTSNDDRASFQRRAERQQPSKAMADQALIQHDSMLSPVSSEPNSPTSPIPPPHRHAHQRPWPTDTGYNPSPTSQTPPGADTFGDQAGGGTAGIAMGVASANARESGGEAMRSLQTPGKIYETGYVGQPHISLAHCNNTYNSTLLMTQLHQIMIGEESSSTNIKTPCLSELHQRQSPTVRPLETV